MLAGGPVETAHLAASKTCDAQNASCGSALQHLHYEQRGWPSGEFTTPCNASTELLPWQVHGGPSRGLVSGQLPWQRHCIIKVSAGGP